MREILFRAKRVDNGKWTYGLLSHNIQKEGSYELQYPLYDSDGFRGYSRYEVISETVGQFTGLTGKNGTKIFEGDIVENGTGKFEVLWSKTKGTFIVRRLVEKDFMYHLADYFHSYEVIGNIHEQTNTSD